MARKHAQVLTSIWMNEDFVTLSDAARLTYLFLLSQPDISLVGVRVARPRVWARRGAPSPEGDLEAALGDLARGGWIAWDQDSDEVWIRSFIKHNVAGSPKALIGPSKAAQAVVSAPIRGWIADSIHPDLRDDFKASFDNVGFADLRALVGRLSPWTPTPRRQVDTPSTPHGDTPSEGVSITET